jgi:ornithine carbamoyltransferase
MKHLLGLEKMSREEIEHILAATVPIKQDRGRHAAQPLAGKIWALLFSKSSTRTRVSFEVGIRELGGQAIFLSAGEVQLGRGEPIKDTARVLARMIDGAVIRTFAQSDVEEFAQYSGLPTINALTDQEHPCQILADIFTYQEKRGPIAGKRVVFVGDGACNVPVSWMFAAAKLDFELRIAAPKKFQPSPELLRRAGGRILCTEDVRGAAHGADVLYTDVWVSMGEEAEAAAKRRAFAGYTISEGLLSLAAPEAIVLHCLPAHRGEEITAEVIDGPRSRVFLQAENRMHSIRGLFAFLCGAR